MAGSRVFARSARLQQFLTFVCERALAGNNEEINEQQIGIHVFGRASDYNPSEDNIVRAHARLLRKKLEEYFDTDGHSESLRILIPKGGYTPTFTPAAHESVPAPIVEPSNVATPRRVWAAWGKVAILFSVVLAAVAISVVRMNTPRPPSEVQKFWNLLFESSRPTFIVPSDTALVLYQRLSGKELTLSQYINKNFDPIPDLQSPNDPDFANSVSRVRYTNLPDTEFCWRVARMPGLDLSRTTMRYARELRLADLKGANAILIGARRANPWVELFHPGLNFQALFDPVRRGDYILNKNPLEKEQPTYAEHEKDGQKWAYSVVAFQPGLNEQGHALLVGGTTTAGTEGALDFVLNEQAFGDFLKKVSAGKPRIPHFEVLFRTGNVAGTARQTEILASRIR